VAINGESCILALPHGNTTFRFTSVKPYLTPNLTLITQIEGIEVEPTGEESSTELTALPVKRGRGRLRRNPDIFVFL